MNFNHAHLEEIDELQNKVDNLKRSGYDKLKTLQNNENHDTDEKTDNGLPSRSPSRSPNPLINSQALPLKITPNEKSNLSPPNLLSPSSAIYDNNNLLNDQLSISPERHINSPFRVNTNHNINDHNTSTAIHNNNNNINMQSLSDKSIQRSIREIVISILKIHTIGFILFILIMLNLKFAISIHYAFGFLWIIDLCTIISCIRMMLIDQEPQSNYIYIIEIIESVNYIIVKILMFLAIENENFLMSYCLIPFGLIVFTHSILLLYQRKIETTIIFILFFGIQLSNFCLKYDLIINWSWRAVFWSFWTLLSFMIGLTFVIFLMLLGKCLTYFCTYANRYEFTGLFWLFFMLAGITTLSCVFVIGLINYLEDPSIYTKNSLSNIMYAIIAYCIVMDILVLIYLPDIENYMHKLTKASETECESDPIEAKNEPKNIVIPKFLLRISSTYFGRANTDDIKQLNQKSLSNIGEKKSISNTRLLKSNAFSYSKLLKKSENTIDSQREVQNNLMTIISARSKEDIESGRQKGNLENNLPKAALELLELKKRNLLDFATLKSSPSPQKVSPIRSVTEVNETEKEVHYPIDYEPVRSLRDLRNEERIFNFDNNLIQELKEDEQTKDQFNLMTLMHKDLKTEISLMRPKNNSILEESQEETNISKIDIGNTKSRANAQQSHLDRSVTTCLICFDKLPNAVFMECGHGGVCYECSIEVWKSTEECYLCRKPITQILQLDLKNYGKSNLIRVLSSTQLANNIEKNHIDSVYESSYE